MRQLIFLLVLLTLTAQAETFIGTLGAELAPETSVYNLEDVQAEVLIGDKLEVRRGDLILGKGVVTQISGGHTLTLKGIPGVKPGDKVYDLRTKEERRVFLNFTTKKAFADGGTRMTLSVPALDPEPFAAASMDIDIESMRVKPGEKVDLRTIPTLFPQEKFPLLERDSSRILEVLLTRISELQKRLYSEDDRSILFLVQGMDNAGKGGTYKSVFAPLILEHEAGIERAAFKAPSKEERDHSFLWRISDKMPAKGNIGFHDRCHYEDIAEVRVLKLAPESVWGARYGLIRDYESLHSKMGTKIVKIFLHLGKDEQRARLEERRLVPHKKYKFSAEDAMRRKNWSKYTDAYNDILNRTSTEESPWYIVPADDKNARNLIIATILLKTLEEMDPKYPVLPDNLIQVPIPD